MLAGTAGLEEGREAHRLDCMIILDEVWNDLDVATIAQCWAHAKILPRAIEADIVAEHGSRFSKKMTNETKASIDEITKLLSGMKLPSEPVTDALEQSIYGTVSLCMAGGTRETFVASLETWVEIEETEEVKEMFEQDISKAFNDSFSGELLTKTMDLDDSDDEQEQPQHNPTSDVLLQPWSNSTLDVLDLSDISNSLIKLQQQLEQNGNLGAADFIDMARNELLKVIKRCQAEAATAPKRQAFMDAYLKK